MKNLTNCVSGSCLVSIHVLNANKNKGIREIREIGK
jgi:hypothetical protein